ncbi:hypothetical protein B5M47_03940 [candidate division CPR3 bacterium 4484_211]|uniref:CopG family transcriptional regulator n=1 Tax=candidate division CPR3 bacterium 4484_211 TaxID=1968527 RepID=A0A1W9NW62_UNCC3|nr:MAG: hypothetical protein B5M47_03940 [candidate division CPR3 bacterium 4484_211]
MSNFTSVSIPNPLFQKTKKRLAGTGFTSVSSFVAFLLREFLSWSKEDRGKEDSIKEKLRKLGYF